MRAKWEYSGVPENGASAHAFDDGWEPFAVTAPSPGVCHVHYRRLVRARCKAGHDADFDDKACQYVDFATCGKPIVAVPVDPLDMIPLRREEN